MTNEQLTTLWNKIHSEPIKNPIQALIDERKRLLALWEASLRKPPGPSHTPKRFAKGAAKHVGKVLKSSFIKSSSGNLDNPTLKGKYKTLERVKETHCVESPSEGFEKPTMPKTSLLPTSSPLHQSTYYVGCEWDEGKDKFYLPTDAKERIAYMRKCWGI